MTLNDFLKPPTKRRWLEEIRAGWPGPDGSSFSTDTICGVRIGVTSADWEYRKLPANLHDWRYRLGRAGQLGGEYRQRADELHRDDLLRTVRGQLSYWNPLRYVAVTRCHARYAFLRAGARRAFTKAAKVRAAKWQE